MYVFLGVFSESDMMCWSADSVDQVDKPTGEYTPGTYDFGEKLEFSYKRLEFNLSASSPATPFRHLLDHFLDLFVWDRDVEPICVYVNAYEC